MVGGLMPSTVFHNPDGSSSEADGEQLVWRRGATAMVPGGQCCMEERHSFYGGCCGQVLMEVGWGRRGLNNNNVGVRAWLSCRDAHNAHGSLHRAMVQRGQ